MLKDPFFSRRPPLLSHSSGYKLRDRLSRQTHGCYKHISGSPLRRRGFASIYLSILFLGVGWLGEDYERIMRKKGHLICLTRRWVPNSVNPMNPSFG
uniref:AlNc14C236G9396 protein n=1 Tax=Albugo laibachii Nc14 TaxID=890382 RepID=F0W8C5_9STRA|nr:AlNc14C34G3056 [Albugo laibachii Nc14]CCA24378.1 AlNc14C236G9396 [Albugo laibachii Nc14]|eukprot:CCA24378.1 AlNc14C236G9396 [Albugo laibachii Nc14]